MQKDDEIDLTQIGKDSPPLEMDGGDDAPAPKDDQARGAQAPQKDDDKPQKISIRESIKQAISDVNERAKKEDTQDSNEGKETKQVSSGTSEDPENKDNKREVQQQTITDSDIKPPVSWSKEAKESWNSLPPAIQNAVLKREKEFSDGIKQYADRAKKFEEIEPLFAPHRQSMMSNGISESQVVARLFEWFNNLSSSDPARRLNTFAALAKSFNVDLSQFVPRKEGQEGVTTSVDASANIDISTHPAFQSLNQTVSTLQQTLVQQQQQAAVNYITEWAKDKPHFERVRQTMYALLSSGAIPTKNGIYDLDAAYDKAIRMDDELYQQIEQERISKAATEKLKELTKKEKEKAEQLQRKRDAASSLKPAAPTGNTSLNGRRKSNQPMSIRDSIRAAIEEHRG